VNSRLPSGANVNRLKNDVKVSLAYNEVLLVGLKLIPPPMLGDAEGMMAGSGSDGLGETDRLID